MVFRRTDLTAAESLGHLLGVTPVGGCQQSGSFPGSQGDKDSDEGGAWSLGLSALSAGLSFPGPAQRAGSLPFCSPDRRRGSALLAQETCLHHQAAGRVMASNHSAPDKSTFALSKLSVRVERP